MKVVESIKSAREKNVSDSLILQEIKKQNPDKEVFFNKAAERGASPTDILNEIIKQNSPEKEVSSHSSPSPSATSPPSSSPVPSPSSPPTSSTPSSVPSSSPSLKDDPAKGSGNTVLTKDAQEREEQIRNSFLKRVEARERGESLEENDFFSDPQAPLETSNEEMIQNLSDNPKPKLPFPLIIVVGLLFLGAFILLAINFF